MQHVVRLVAVLAVLATSMVAQAQTQEKAQEITYASPISGRLTALNLIEAGASKEIVDAAMNADDVELHTLTFRVAAQKKAIAAIDSLKKAIADKGIGYRPFFRIQMEFINAPIDARSVDDALREADDKVVAEFYLWALAPTYHVNPETLKIEEAFVKWLAAARASYYSPDYERLKELLDKSMEKFRQILQDERK